MSGFASRGLPTGQYRSDLDGLRALAVLSVLFFHAFPEKFSGGYVGVDVFFVISGFLITGIISKEVQQGRFLFKSFYIRRINRIFPVLIALLVSTLALGWFFLLPVDYQLLGKHVVAGAGFGSNLLLWSEVGYFDRLAETKPLLHLWSLGIEEQFYLFWPVLILLFPRKTSTLRRFLIGLALLSFSYCVFLSFSDHDAAFYSPFSRFWELSVGGVLAIPGVAQSFRSKQRQPDWISWLGLVLILIPAFVFNRLTPEWWVLSSVLGAALMIYAGTGASVNRRILALKPLVGIGMISYPLYLWHWFFLVLFKLQS